MHKILFSILLSIGFLINPVFASHTETLPDSCLEGSCNAFFDDPFFKSKINVTSFPRKPHEERSAFEVRDPKTGFKVFGIIHKPMNQGIYPVIIFHHGFLGHKLGQRDVYVRLSEMLTQKGFVVVRFDFHGCGDSEGDRNCFSLSDIESNGQTVLDWVKKLDYIDNNRIGLFGNSLGSHVVIHLARSNPETVRCAVLWAPVADGLFWLTEVKKNTQNSPADQQFDTILPNQPLVIADKLICQFTKTKDAVAAAKIPDHIPIVHLQGMEDSVTPISHQNLFRNESLKRNRTMTFVQFPDTDHSFADSPHHQEIMETITFYFSCLLVEPN